MPRRFLATAPTLVLFGVLVVVLLVGGLCLLTVDRAEFVYVTQLGRHVITYDGETHAGLHFRLPWPIQSVQRLDHRLQVFDLPGAELLTHDPKGQTIDKTLTIDAYVCWRIADSAGVDRFLRTVGTPDRAKAILGQRISSRLGAEIGNMKLDDLISVAPLQEVEERMDRLRRRLLETGNSGDVGAVGRENLKEQAQKAYGIEIVDIRLRRFNYPAQVRDAIFDRIRSERNKKIADYQSEGAQLADNIKSQAESEARTILADARAQEQRLKGHADAEADRIRNQAHSKDVAFYAFLKKLEEYQRILGDNKTVLLLSAHRELFDVLFKPPSPGQTMTPTRPVATPATTTGAPVGPNGNLRGGQ
ncbi:MAG: protease modulator HflC [Gemmataceae bacterium]|nr:protease modulator HflC [Gemmataceae bacterium]